MRHALAFVLLVGSSVVVGCGDDGANRTPPETELDSVPAALSKEKHVSITFHANGNANGFVCALDGATPSQCIPPFEADVTDGEHTFEVAAAIGIAVDETPATHTWRVDATAPDTVLVMGPPSLDNTIDPALTFTGSDPGGGTVTFECKLDGGAFAPCSSPDQVTITDGSHSFEVRAVDAAGNVDPTPATHAWALDSSTPDTAITTGPIAASTVLPNVSFTFSSPDAAATFECSLDGDVFAACTSPKAYPGLADGPHTFTARAKNAAGTVDPSPATRMFIVDGTAPTVAISAQPMNPSNDSTPSFTFASPDATATFECRIDAGTFAACTSVFTSAAIADGSHTFRVRAKDPVGNQGTEATYTWVIDTMVPTVTITSGPTGMVTTTNASFTFTTTGSPIATECQLDAGAFAACASPRAYTAVAEGAHAFTVRVTDAAGNTGMASQMWIVDTTAPAVTITAGPTGPTADSTPTFTFTVTGATTTECGIDGVFVACATMFTTAALADGAHSFVVRASDAAGNLASATRAFSVDTAGPTVVIVTRPANPSGSASASFTFTASEGSPQCKLDGGAFAACTSPKAYTGLADGSHTFTVQSADSLGNLGSATYTWTVDTTAPVVTIVASPTNPSNSASASFTFTVSEGSPQCKLDAGAFAACTSPKTYAGLADGSHTFTVQSADALGNLGSASYTWTIDTTAPTVTILTTPTNPVASANATFTFTVSEGTPQCKLDAGAFAACTSPKAYTGLADGTHTFTVQSADAIGNLGTASFTWVIDTAAPIVAIINKPTNPSNTAAATFTFTVSEGSPQCKLDGGALAACTSPKAYTGLADGSHTFTVQSADANGNIGSASYTWTIDTTAPTVTILTTPANPTTSGSATFTFSVSEGSPQCKLDGGAFAACTTPKAYTGLADGTHTFTVQSADAIGNVGSASFTWVIDSGGPTVAIVNKPANPANSSAATFTFTVSEGSPQCKLDGGALAACSSPKSYTGLADGSHTFTVQSADALGNLGSASYTWTIDTTAPTVTILTHPTNPTISANATFTFSVSEGSPQCRLDGGAFAACTSPKAYTALLDGSHTFTVQSADALGNLGTASFTWVIDSTAPAVAIVNKPANPSNSSAATFTFTVSEGSPQCKLDGGVLAACTSPKAYTGLADGSHTFTVQSADTIGNIGSASYTWTIDTTAPTVTILTTPANPSNQTTATFTFSVSEGSPQCKLDTGAFAACTSPRSYPGLGDGLHTFTVQSADALGNTGSAAFSWTIDATGPIVTLDSVPPAKWPVNYFDFQWHANETATYECLLNGAAFTPCTPGAAVTASAYGTQQTFSVRGKDSLGNVGAFAVATWTPSEGLVLHYAWEQGTLRNTSLLAQVPALSPDVAGQHAAVGGWAGTSLRNPPATSYPRTNRALTSSGSVYTASIWVRPMFDSAGGVLWSNANGTTGGHTVQLSSDVITLEVFENGVTYTVTGKVPLQQWSNVAVRTSGPFKGAELIINGIRSGLAQPANGGTGFETNQAPRLTVGPVVFTDLDDLRFYNTYLINCDIVRGSTPPGAACVAMRPRIELDFEETVINQTGTMSVVANQPLWSQFAHKLGLGLKLASPQVPLAIDNFAQQSPLPGHSLTMWVDGSTPPDRLFDFTRACSFAAQLGTCGVSIAWTAFRQFEVFTGTGLAVQKTTVVPAAPLSTGMHSFVLTEQKSNGVTTSIKLYVDGVLATTVAIGTGDLFGIVDNQIRMTTQPGSAIDEVELWPRDIGTDPEMLCENGFDGEFNPASGTCSLTSN